MPDLQERLNKVSGTIQYLKQEKIRIEAEKKVLLEDLKKEGIEDIDKLPEIIEKKKLELEETKTQFAETVGKFELRVIDLENKVK